MITRRHGALLSAAATLMLAGATPLTLAAQDATAAPATSRGLLDPIGGLLGGVLTTLGSTLNSLLGSSQQTALQGVTSALGSGAAPSATTLAPVTTFFTGLAGNGTLPLDLRTTAADVAALLTNPTSPSSALSVPSLSAATSLLTQLQGVSGLDSSAVSTLAALIAAITSAATTVGGGAPAPLPIVGAIPVSGSLLAPLDSLVTALAGGSTPTGGLLSPVSDLLRQVAATPGIDAIVGATLTQLADQIDATAGALGGDLLGTVSNTLRSLSTTSGLPSTLAGVVGSLAFLLGSNSSVAAKPGTTTTPGGGTGSGPGGAAYGTARIVRARVDRRHGTVRVALACRAGSSSCRTLVAAVRGRKVEATTKVLTIGAGKQVKRTLRLSPATRRALKRHTLKFRVTAIGPSGKASSRSVTARLPRAAHR